MSLGNIIDIQINLIKELGRNIQECRREISYLKGKLNSLERNIYDGFDPPEDKSDKYEEETKKEYDDLTLVEYYNKLKNRKKVIPK